jgi:hypothetical protein
MRNAAKRTGWVYVLALACCVALYGVSTRPAFCHGRDVKDLVGGLECKPTCKSYAACAGCNGNCTGAANGTICGKFGTSTIFYCSAPVPGGSGCNLGPVGDRYGTNCQCDKQACGEGSGNVICANGVKSCSLD